MFERLFAVILSVTDIKDITFVGRIAMVILKKKPALSKSQFNAVGIHEQARTVWPKVNNACFLQPARRNRCLRISRPIAASIID